MSKAIIELYVDIDDLGKQLDIIFDNGCKKITVERDESYVVYVGDMARYETKYFIRATISQGEEE